MRTRSLSPANEGSRYSTRRLRTTQEAPAAFVALVHPAKSECEIAACCIQWTYSTLLAWPLASIAVSGMRTGKRWMAVNSLSSVERGDGIAIRRESRPPASGAQLGIAHAFVRPAAFSIQVWLSFAWHRSLKVIGKPRIDLGLSGGRLSQTL